MQPTPFQTVVRHLTRDQAPRVWSLLISVFGDLAQDPGARISGSLLRHMTERIGIKPEAMRVAIHRLRKDGWIDSQRHGRTSVYFLTSRGRAQTTEASPRIYATGQAAERAWVVLANPGQPAPGDGMPGVWIASHVLMTPVAPVGSGLFVTKVEASTALPDWMTSRICDDATVMMTRNFAAALAAVRPCLDPAPALGPLEVAAIRVLVVHGWRRIVLKTPVLPDHVFPPAWQGPRCRDLVSDLLDRYPRPQLEDLEAEIGGDPGK